MSPTVNSTTGSKPEESHVLGTSFSTWKGPRNATSWVWDFTHKKININQRNQTEWQDLFLQISLFLCSKKKEKTYRTAIKQHSLPSFINKSSIQEMEEEVAPYWRQPCTSQVPCTCSVSSVQPSSTKDKASLSLFQFHHSGLTPYPLFSTLSWLTCQRQNIFPPLVSNTQKIYYISSPEKNSRPEK